MKNNRIRVRPGTIWRTKGQLFSNRVKIIWAIHNKKQYEIAYSYFITPDILSDPFVLSVNEFLKRHERAT
jgi:hypothetical protein